MEAKKNKIFSFNHPKINRKITLTGIIELKMKLADMFLIGRGEEASPYVELYSVANAWVLFERLIYRLVVKPHN